MGAPSKPSAKGGPFWEVWQDNAGPPSAVWVKVDREERRARHPKPSSTPKSSRTESPQDSEELLHNYPAMVETSASFYSDEETPFDEDFPAETFSVLGISADRINSWVYAVDDALRSMGSQLAAMETVIDSIMNRDDEEHDIASKNPDIPLGGVNSLGSSSFPIPSILQNFTDDTQSEFSHLFGTTHLEGPDVPVTGVKHPSTHIHPTPKPPNTPMVSTDDEEIAFFPCFKTDLHESDAPFTDVRQHNTSYKDSTNGKQSEHCSCFESVCFGRADFDQHGRPDEVIEFKEEQRVAIRVSTYDNSAFDLDQPKPQVRFLADEKVKRVPIWARLGWRTVAPPKEASRRPNPTGGILRNGGFSRNGKTCVKSAQVILDQQVETQSLTTESPGQSESGSEAHHIDEDPHSDLHVPSSAEEPRAKDEGVSKGQEDFMSCDVEEKSEEGSGGSRFERFFRKTPQIRFPKLHGSLYIREKRRRKQAGSLAAPLLGAVKPDSERSNNAEDLKSDALQPIYTDKLDSRLRLALLDRFDDVLNHLDSASPGSDLSVVDLHEEWGYGNGNHDSTSLNPVSYHLGTHSKRWLRMPLPRPVALGARSANALSSGTFRSK